MTPTEVEERFDGLRRYLVPVPAVQPGICSVCHTGVQAPYDTCYHCRNRTHISVLPISISLHGGQLHDRLWKYKRVSDGEVRSSFTLDLAIILSMFLSRHLGCIGGEFDRVAIVPPTQQDWGAHKIIGRFQRFADNTNPLTWTDTTARTLTVDPDVRGKRVLLFDDTFTSGRKAIFPAVSALQAAGAEIAGPIVIGRHFNRNWADNEAIWTQLRNADFDIDKCARCDGFRFDPPLREPAQPLF